VKHLIVIAADADDDQMLRFLIVVGVGETNDQILCD
jgi:hypothetical protein